jgi:very-short-patch-repair endonuclease
LATVTVAETGFSAPSPFRGGLGWGSGSVSGEFNMEETSKPHNIVIGQRVTGDKKAFARGQRKEMSPVERVLWQRLRAHQLGGFHFRRQQIIAGYIVDFYCHAAGLAVEVDGDSHDDPAYDAARDAAIARLGVKVIRFTNLEVVRQTDTVLEEILKHLTAV